MSSRKISDDMVELVKAHGFAQVSLEPAKDGGPMHGGVWLRFSAGPYVFKVWLTPEVANGSNDARQGQIAFSSVGAAMDSARHSIVHALNGLPLAP